MYTIPLTRLSLSLSLSLCVCVCVCVSVCVCVCVCRCTKERARTSLSLCSTEDPATMTTDEGVVTVDCQFCGAHYEFEPIAPGIEARHG